MALQFSGQISTGNINRELGKQYSSYMSLWNARNGRYGSINTQSARYPTNGISKTNSGYAFSDWYGYNHSARQASIGLKQVERFVDADTRAWEFRYLRNVELLVVPVALSSLRPIASSAISELPTAFGPISDIVITLSKILAEVILSLGISSAVTGTFAGCFPM